MYEENNGLTPLEFLQKHLPDQDWEFFLNEDRYCSPNWQLDWLEDNKFWVSWHQYCSQIGGYDVKEDLFLGDLNQCVEFIKRLS